MKKAAKVDANQPEIVYALRQAGCTVESLAAVGAGMPDLIVGHCGMNYLIEVKNPSGRGNKLTSDQVHFHTFWRGHVAVVTTPAEALQAVGAIAKF